MINSRINQGILGRSPLITFRNFTQKIALYSNEHTINYITGHLYIPVIQAFTSLIFDSFIPSIQVLLYHYSNKSK